jgi:hypothetical protein
MPILVTNNQVKVSVLDTVKLAMWSVFLQYVIS